MRITDLSRISTHSEATVVSPHVAEDRSANAEFYNSDIPMPTSPRMTQLALNTPAKTTTKPQMSTIEERGEVREMPIWRKALMVAGTALSVIGSVAGLMSIVVLGPIGLAVAAGALLAGIALTRIAIR